MPFRVVNRQGALFGTWFVALGLASFFVSEWSNALVLQLNAFQLVYRGLCTVAYDAAASKDGAAYNFGLYRVTAVIEFAAAAVLLFASLSVSIEAVHHLLEAHDTRPSLVEGFCAFHALSILAYVWFCRRHLLNQKVPMNVAKFLIVELRAPLICVVTCSCVRIFEASRIDVVGAILYAASCALIAARQLQLCTPTLLLSSPHNLAELKDVVRHLPMIHGVISVERFQAWELDFGRVAVAVKIRVAPSVDANHVVKQCRAAFLPSVLKVTIETEEGAELSDSQVDSVTVKFPAPPVQLNFPVYVLSSAVSAAYLLSSFIKTSSA